MKKFLSALSLTGLLLPVLALAQPANGGITPIVPPSNVDFQKLITGLANWFTGILIAIAVLLIIYAAFLFLFGHSDEDTLKKAKKIIIFSAIAIGIALVAQGFVFIIKQFVISNV